MNLAPEGRHRIACAAPPRLRKEEPIATAGLTPWPTICHPAGAGLALLPCTDSLVLLVDMFTLRTLYMLRHTETPACSASSIRTWRRPPAPDFRVAGRHTPPGIGTSFAPQTDMGSSASCVSRIAFRIFSGVMGRSLIHTPVAVAMAWATAPRTGRVLPSPISLAP